MDPIDDPRRMLHHKEVARQAAAARELARVGDWEDLDALVALAIHSKSSAVRLYTAAAAADIAHRLRVAGEIDLERELALLSYVAESDPGRNPSLLMLLSAVEDRRALDRLARMLRDPRNTVRAGAIAAMRRLALSCTAAARLDIGPRVAEWLAHAKLPADAALELVNLVGEVGLAEAEAQIAPLARHSERHADAVALAVERLERRRHAAGWQGLWRADGADVWELVQEGAPIRWLAIGLDGATLDGRPVSVAVDAGGALVEGAPARLVFAAPIGSPEERVPVVQVGAESFWGVTGKLVADLLDDDPEALPPLPRGLPDPTAALEGPAAAKPRALWAWRAGDLDAARAGLSALTDRARPQHSLFYFLAKVCEEQGDRAAARAAAEAFLERVKPKAPFRDRAEALVVRLGG